jgi:hypothetical protein
MLKEVDDKVWEWVISSEELVAVRQKHLISGMMRRTDGVHVRVVSAESPGKTAASVTPTLEDAYLYLLSGTNGEHE